MQKKVLILAAMAAMPLAIANVQAEVEAQVEAPALTQSGHLTQGQQLVNSQSVYQDEEIFDQAVEHLMAAGEGSDVAIANEANLELGILYFNAIQTMTDTERAGALSTQVQALLTGVAQSAEGQVQETAIALVTMHALNTGDLETAGQYASRLDGTTSTIPAVPMILRSYYLATGDQAKARSLLEEIVAQSTQPAIQAEASFALGELLVGIGELEEAETVLEDSVRRFKELGAEQDAAQIEQYFLVPIRTAKAAAEASAQEAANEESTEVTQEA